MRRAARCGSKASGVVPTRSCTRRSKGSWRPFWPRCRRRPKCRAPKRTGAAGSAGRRGRRSASPSPGVLPPLRMLLVLDSLTGHYTTDLVLWIFDHGIMPLCTPLGGSWLNVAESIQRILKSRALDGHHLNTPEEIIAWLEAAARGWNREPTPFEWGGKRQARREHMRRRHYALGGSGARSQRPPWEGECPDETRCSTQLTHSPAPSQTHLPSSSTFPARSSRS